MRITVMSQMGHSRRLRCPRYVRSSPNSGGKADMASLLIRANRRLGISMCRGIEPLRLEHFGGG